MMAALALALHALAAAIWVGGMFFVHTALRPGLTPLPSAERLALLGRVLGRFFAWVIAAILALLASGYWLIFVSYGGFGGVGVHVHVMHLTGWLMIVLFLHLFFAPWKRLRRALAAGDTPAAARWFKQVRLIVTTNLALGLLTIAIGAGGRFWP